MIALTTMMWMAETLGYDTAPMEGFSETAVRQALGIPDRVRVVALLAIGHLKGPDKPYGKRFAMERVVFNNKWGDGIEAMSRSEIGERQSALACGLHPVGDGFARAKQRGNDCPWKW